MSRFKFSVIIPTNNSTDGIEKTLNSLTGQTLNFEKHCEAIVVDSDLKSVEKTCKTFSDKYPNNVKCISADPINAQNAGIESADGDYLIFLEANDYLSENTLEQVLNFINDHPQANLITIPTYYYKNGRRERYLDYPIRDSSQHDLKENPELAQLIGISTFIRRQSAGDVKFEGEHNRYITFLNELLVENPVLGVCSKGSYYMENIEEKTLPTEDIAFNQSEYEQFIENNLNRLMEKSRKKFSEIPKFVEYCLLNQIKWLSSIERSKEKLDLSELTDIMEHIDEKTISNNILIENDTELFLFLLKYGDDLNQGLVEELNLDTVFIDIYDIINNELHILASMTNVRDRKLELLANGKKVKAKTIEFPQYDLYSLGHRYAQNYTIETSIPLSTDEKYELEFKSENKSMKIDFARPCNFSRSVGYAKTRNYISVLENEKIIVKRKTTLNWIKQEMKSLVRMVKNRESGFGKAIPFRIAYMIAYPFMKNKRIWFYMDRPNESDDNGLHLFRYSAKKYDNVERYFILSSDNPDYDEIKKIGKVINYKSLKHRFLGLYAENIISSHPDNEIIYPFWGGYPFFAGLLKSNNIFLQHGILKDNISGWLNKKNMNLSFFLVSSKREYDSTFKYPYNYSKGVVNLRGLPRFDNLENVKDKRQIIIMPSWRRYLTGKSSGYIQETEYFKRFNSLINNEKLIAKAREYDYEIIFRPHPNVYNFIELFDENEYVKIDFEKTKFQTLFNNGSLLLTDYSSVAFDFAYLHKPVIYYQYGEDYHFDVEDSFFDYETMGLGEICRDEDELVDAIIEYIENECRIKDEYSKRVDKFFLFTDKNNCMRVYEAIKKIPLKD